MLFLAVFPLSTFAVSGASCGCGLLLFLLPLLPTPLLLPGQVLIRCSNRMKERQSLVQLLARLHAQQQRASAVGPVAATIAVTAAATETCLCSKLKNTISLTHKCKAAHIRPTCCNRGSEGCASLRDSSPTASSLQHWSKTQLRSCTLLCMDARIMHQSLAAQQMWLCINKPVY